MGAVVSGDHRPSQRAGEDRQPQLPVLHAAHPLEMQQDAAHCFQGQQGSFSLKMTRVCWMSDGCAHEQNLK